MSIRINARMAQEVLTYSLKYFLLHFHSHEILLQIWEFLPWFKKVFALIKIVGTETHKMGMLILMILKTLTCILMMDQLMDFFNK